MRFADEPYVLAETHFSLKDGRRLQEWLTLRGYAVEIDNQIGPATTAALDAFRRDQGLRSATPDAVAAALAAPLTRALEPLPKDLKLAFSDVAMLHAARWLDAGAREVRHKNDGPFVRALADGFEGRAWCAYFVSKMLRMASETTGQALPIPGSPDCDALGAQARKAGRLIVGSDEKPVGLAPGWLFLLWRGSPERKDYFHVGFVANARLAGAFGTIEGNSNEAGSPDGVRVIPRTRGFKSTVDFIRI